LGALSLFAPGLRDEGLDIRDAARQSGSHPFDAFGCD